MLDIVNKYFPNMSGLRIDRWKLLVYLTVCICLLPLLTLRDFTPGNELRYLSIIDEALDNGTFWSFTNHGIPYADKPPLYFWCLMLCRWIAGNHVMLLMGLFSLIPGLVTLNVMDRWSSEALDIRCRKHSLLVLLTCAFFIGMMVVLRMDMLMTMFIVLSLRSFYTLYRLRNSKSDTISATPRIHKQQWLFGLFLFLALFSKGPLGILIPLFSTIVFLLINRNIRQTFFYWGWRPWLLLLLLCIVWFGSVFLEGGPDYLNNLVFHQTIDRGVNSFHHARPYWYYLTAIWYILAPWCLLIIGLIVVSFVRWKDCSTLQQYFLTISVTTFVLLSCISAKLQVYMLPAVPFMAYSAMMSFPTYRYSGWIRAALGVPSAIYLLALPGYFIALHTFHLDIISSPWFAIAAGILTLAGAQSLYYLICYKKERAARRSINPIAIGLLITLFAGGWGIPSVNPQTGYALLCEKTLEIKSDTHYKDIYTWRISRPENMDVFLHQDIIEIPKDSVSQTSSLHGALLIVPQKRYNELPDIREADTTQVGKYVIISISKN